MPPASAPPPLTPRALAKLVRATIGEDRAASGVHGWTAPGRIRGPVFLIGAPRSGTTFLGESLGAAPGISYHHEPIATKAVTGAVLDGRWRGDGHRIFQLTYLLLLAASEGRGRRFSEKTPQHCFLIDRLASWFPDAQFLHIVRDGRDAALSHADKPWLAAASAGSGRREPGGYLWGPYPRFWVEPDRRAEFATTTDLHRCIWAWRRHTESALANGARLPAARYLEVRYERVVTDPGASATQIASYLGLSAADATGFGDRLRQANPNSVGRWRTELDPAGTEAIEGEAGQLLRRLGYL